MESETDSNDAFFEAVLDNDLDTVRRKIDSGLTGLSKSATTGDMALHFACLNSKLDIIRLLNETLNEGEINTINIEQDDTICGTALHMAMDGQVDTAVVELLLSLGADPNARDAKGSPVLYELIYRAWEDFDDEFKSDRGVYANDSWETIECETDTENVSDNEEADSSKSSWQEGDGDKTEGKSYLDKLELLYKHGADINTKHTETRMTPFHFWFQNFNWSMETYVDKEIPKWCFNFLRLLLDKGADPNCVNGRNETTMNFLAQRHFKPCHNVFLNSYKDLLSIVMPVFTKTADSNIYGRNILHDAAEMANCVLLTELLRGHCDVNVKDKFGLTPLHIITHNITEDESEFVVEIMNELLHHGGDINVPDNHGSSPLHHAIHLKNHTATKHLLAKGASVDIKDHSGRTPRDLASIEGDSVINEMLGISSYPQEQDVGEVSDIRYGMYYPLCCPKHFGAKSDYEDKKSEFIEPVSNAEIDAWLQTHKMCNHNRTFILQNAIPSLETNVEQMALCSKDSVAMKTEMYDLANMTAAFIGSANPLFKCNVVFGGSVSEGTKIGSFDESDLVFYLCELQRHVEIIEENCSKPGFVKLKVTNPAVFVDSQNEDLIDDDGYLKRTELSNKFHKYLEKALSTRKIWQGNSFFSFWGTTNSIGECFNIGQLNLLWFGPFQKRQHMSVDIAVALKLEGWQSNHWNDDIQITDRETAKYAGCYLVLKDLSSYFQGENENKIEDDEEDDEEDDIDYEQANSVLSPPTNLKSIQNILFKVSVSPVEHAVMRFLPSVIKDGYKLAKCIFLQCPPISFPLSDIDSHDDGGNEYDDTFYLKQTDGGLVAVTKSNKYITSFVLKTGLFHELHSRNIMIPILKEDIVPEQWNRIVIEEDLCSAVPPTASDIEESLVWAMNIYKRVLTLVTEHKFLPEYFMPPMEATKVRGKTESFVKVITTFLNTSINLLETFEVPEKLPLK